MSNVIRKSGSIVSVVIMMALVLALPINVRAAEAKSYTMPVSYMNKYVSVPSQTNVEGINTANVVATISSDELGKGTVVTLTGIPSDSINFQANDEYTVVFTEGDSISTTYGGWYDGAEYDDGTIVYTLQTDEPTLSISFGDWRMKDASGKDASYVISADGVVAK